MKSIHASLLLGALVLLNPGRIPAQEVGYPYWNEVQPASFIPEFWAQADYLLLWSKADRAPGPLVTTGPAGDPTQGILGNDTTKVLYDGSKLNYDRQSGVRLDIGRRFGPNRIWAFQVGGFMQESHTLHGEVNSNRTDGSPVIARPFFNVQTGQEDAQVITSPQDPLGGRYLGGIDVFADHRTWGGEANIFYNLTDDDSGRWDLIGGFRYLGQKDELRFSLSSTVLTPGAVGFRGSAAIPPNIVSWRDFFETNNDFYGGQIGLRGYYESGPWSADLTAKFGLGNTVQKLHVAGHTLHTDSAGTTMRETGGLYALPSNIGNTTRDHLSFITDWTFQGGFRITPRVRALLGYTILYWNNVVRPGRQINRNIDPRQVPANLAFDPNAGATEPGLIFRATGYWTQGLNFGLEFTY